MWLELKDGQTDVFKRHFFSPLSPFLFKSSPISSDSVSNPLRISRIVAYTQIHRYVRNQGKRWDINDVLTHGAKWEKSVVRDSFFASLPRFTQLRHVMFFLPLFLRLLSPRQHYSVSIDGSRTCCLWHRGCETGRCRERAALELSVFCHPSWLTTTHFMPLSLFPSHINPPHGEFRSLNISHTL